MKAVDKTEKAIRKLNFTASTKLHDRVLGDVLGAQEESKEPKPSVVWLNIWRTIMEGRVRITKLSLAAVIVIAAGLAFAGGYASGISAMASAGALRAADVKAIKEMVQEYIEAARNRDLKAMYELSDQVWRKQNQIWEQTRADVHIAAGDLEIGDVSTTWREKPETNVALSTRGGSGGMALVFFVVRENGRWVADRSGQSAEERRVDSHVHLGADLCAELIEPNRKAYDEDGTITVSFADLTETQRECLKLLFGIVNDSGTLTEYGRQFTNLEHSTVWLDRKSDDQVVIHLVTEDDDHFLAVHLKSEN